MKKILLALTIFILIAQQLTAQRLPCSRPIFRQFDFWIGEWEAFGTDGSKAGDSKITLILDSCVVLEEWVSAALQQGLRYAGKSYNTFNTSQRQWQQTWVDNTGATTEYLEGKLDSNKMVFKSVPFKISKDTFGLI